MGISDRKFKLDWLHLFLVVALAVSLWSGFQNSLTLQRAKTMLGEMETASAPCHRTQGASLDLSDPAEKQKSGI